MKLSDEERSDIMTLIEVSGNKDKIEKSDIGMMSANRNMQLTHSFFPIPVDEEKNKEASEAETKQFFDMLKEEYDIEELMAMLVPTYKRIFTHKETKELIAFYKTDTGKKMSQAFPQINVESINIDHAYMTNLVKRVSAAHPDLKVPPFMMGRP